GSVTTVANHRYSEVPSDMTTAPPVRRRHSRLWLIAAILAVTVAAAMIVAVALVRHRPPPAVALPLHAAGQVALPGDSSRFDYASLDPDRGLLFIAHLGASQVIEVNIHTGRVVRVIDRIDDVHGVLVVATRHRVYATATGANPNHLPVIDLTPHTNYRQVPQPGYDHDHSLRLNPTHPLAFVACDGNATLLTVDLNTWQTVDTQRVGNDPDFLAYDPGPERLYV